jgi:hypothetical protein
VGYNVLPGPADKPYMADFNTPEPAEAPEETTARDSEAEYSLEYPCKCPHCLQILRTVAVIRMLRTKVNFTSTMPRRGRAVICPQCRKVLTVELNTLG